MRSKSLAVSRLILTRLEPTGTDPIRLVTDGRGIYTRYLASLLVLWARRRRQHHTDYQSNCSRVGLANHNVCDNLHLLQIPSQVVLT